ncbi:hypothetical protein A3A84_02855 [Candidatus Collierbacteria bacterium RIFCSPLOWO2_01_FULL_50_23]|uniref:Heat-inducible transcription repressor HrcA C-terminal domain-containing protein n=2 Tax=Candidatus Collieribacteriota TaxID=1752725 RepID=A0A1F5EWE1_9BACT|nr:MAG: hypothetical protein A2703_01150 [Candidatus Collierbacteria bacterium RIFCSPHIGHO2_01_FULL_50_25]OGD71721.1 MAG: hypothetical protein A3D09_04045 [Candidatus Collierbacteria bacterium RIFCSPHIGHO2_02_FULL_49_10]OGD75006.1 MAG: hypothetical protein A3A84_02855 [Candidatus Collierbacteria bacterium RIFCSPLOWO2_01_FULL_50_23]
MDLSSRQTAIIKAIVEEYTSSAEPVGSVTLENKYRLGVSPATLRNEMAALEEKGFLAQPHASAGRVPTSVAIKFYVNELMKERDLSVAEQVAVKENVWDYRSNPDALLRESVRVLADRTKSLSFATLDKDRTYHSGYANLLLAREFFNIDLTREIFDMLDHSNRLMEIFGRALGAQPIHLLIGRDLGVDIIFEPVGCLFADVQIGDRRGQLGIIGPCRQAYDHNIPLVRYVANLVNQIAETW